MTGKKRVSLERLRAAAAAGGPLSTEALANASTAMSEITISMSGHGAHTARGRDLMPHRDDVVAAWLREQRKQYEGSPAFASAYNAIDALLDDYKLRADLGKGLTDDMTGEPF